MHMGRYYPFDLVGKAFSTLPFQEKQTNRLLTNFDLSYETMTRNVIGFGGEQQSPPGVYVCSTDIIFLMNGNHFVFFSVWFSSLLLLLLCDILLIFT